MRCASIGSEVKALCREGAIPLKREVVQERCNDLLDRNQRFVAKDVTFDLKLKNNRWEELVSELL